MFWPAKMIRSGRVGCTAIACVYSSIWVFGGMRFTGVQLSANHTPELAPVGSFTPIHSRAGVAPCAAVHTTSVTTSEVPATVLNGADGTSTHVADGAPVRIHSPLDVAAMKVVGVV